MNIEKNISLKKKTNYNQPHNRAIFVKKSVKQLIGKNHSTYLRVKKKYCIFCSIYDTDLSKQN